jgi:hypothetical protein
VTLYAKFIPIFAVESFVLFSFTGDYLNLEMFKIFYLLGVYYKDVYIKQLIFWIIKCKCWHKESICVKHAFKTEMLWTCLFGILKIRENDSHCRSIALKTMDRSIVKQLEKEKNNNFNVENFVVMWDNIQIYNAKYWQKMRDFIGLYHFEVIIF